MMGPSRSSKNGFSSPPLEFAWLSASARLRLKKKRPIAVRMITPNKTLNTMLGMQTSPEQTLGWVGNGLRVDISEGVVGVVVVLTVQDHTGHTTKWWSSEIQFVKEQGN